MRTKRVEYERRMRVMAKAKVEMLLGLYVWPDGRSPVNSDGSPRVSNRELLRIAGYSPDYKSPTTTLFANDYFQSAVKTEMARRENKAGALTRYDPSRLSKIRDLLLDELETRLIAAPETFTRSELLQYTKEFELLERGNKPGGAGKPSSDKMNQFNAFISRSVTVMNQSEQEHLVSTASDAGKDRIAHLQTLIDQANVVEGDADDCDVVDAEVSPVSD